MNLKRNFTSQKKFHYQVDGEKNPLHYNANGGQFLAGLDIKKSKKCKLEKIDISRNFFELWNVYENSRENESFLRIFDFEFLYVFQKRRYPI